MSSLGLLVTSLSVSLSLGFVACSSSDGKAVGKACFASAECADGLTCDFGQAPSVCSDQQSGVPDATLPGTIDAANPIDATPLPDAPPGTPDAAPLPDANLTPDAGAVDAGLPDAALPPDGAI